MSALKNEQHSACFDGSRDIFVAEYIIDGTGRWHRFARTLDGFHVLTKGCGGVRDPLFHRLAGRETSLDVREPDTEGAIRLLFDDRHIMHRHPIDTPSRVSNISGIASCTVMPALVAGIHVLKAATSKTWMAGTAMTMW